ncbi:uncharacterized protein LOC115213513 isoform X1 [Argonauta hians]
MGEDSGYFSRRSCQFRLPSRKQHQQTDTNNCKKRNECGCGVNYINKSETIPNNNCFNTVSNTNSCISTTVENCTNNNDHAGINNTSSGYRCGLHDRSCMRTRPVGQIIDNSQRANTCSLKPSEVFDSETDRTKDLSASSAFTNSINNNIFDDLNSNCCTSTANLAYCLHSGPVHQVDSSAVETDTAYNTGNSSSCGYSPRASDNCGRTSFYPNRILRLSYSDLDDSDIYSNLSKVFKDEQDFEDFKEELKDFQHLKDSFQESKNDHNNTLCKVPENNEKLFPRNNATGDYQRNKQQSSNYLITPEENFSTRNSDRIIVSNNLPVPPATTPASLSSLHSLSSCQPHCVNTCISSSPTPNSSEKAESSIRKRSSSNSVHPLKYLTSSSFRNVSAPHDMLMDFFKSDENFQEFEREFANLGSDFNVFGRLGQIEDNEDGDEVFTTGDRNFNAQGGVRTPIPVKIDFKKDASSGACLKEPKPLTELKVKHDPLGSKQDFGVLKVPGKNDSFSEFFDNDEDFKEFEKEFANFKLRRRSRAFADDFNRRSNCDLFADFFPKLENQEKIERRNRAPVNDWDYLFNKIKRNSGFLDVNDLPIPQNPTFPAVQNPKRTHNEDISSLSHYKTNDNSIRKPIEIAVQRRPPLPPMVPKCHHTPPGQRKKALELKIEHVSSPTQPSSRNDVSTYLKDNVDSITSKRLPTLIDDDKEESDSEVPSTVLHIDEIPVDNSTSGASGGVEETSRVIIEHRFSGGISKPTLTITRRTNKLLDEASDNEPHVIINPQLLSELKDKRRHTDPPRIIIEHRFSPREHEPGSSKQNRFSTALEFLQDVDSGQSKKDEEKPHKDCQYTCHKTCRQLVTLDCANNLPNSTSDGSIETSLSEPASTPSSNSIVSDALSNDETDSGYRSGPISDEILPKKEPSEATLNREELKSKLQEYNNNVPNANLALDNKYTKKSSDVDSECSRVSSDFGLEHFGESAQSEPSRYITSNEENSCTAEAHPESDSDFYEDESINLASKESDGETFQGFIKVTLNLIRPITMSLGARPPSIYEVLTREHIVEQNTQSISFYMPRDTVKSIHVDSETTTKEVIAALLKKFKILDNPRKFAMYEQEFKNKKLVRLRRVMPEEFPLQVCLGWETSKLESYRLVLQENEASGDIDWSNFSNPELNNFVKVLDREESEHIQQLQYKYHMMKKAVERRMKELRAAQQEAKHSQ